jgi:hypothetical protein
MDREKKRKSHWGQLIKIWRKGKRKKLEKDGNTIEIILTDDFRDSVAISEKVPHQAMYRSEKVTMTIGFAIWISYYSAERNSI